MKSLFPLVLLLALYGCTGPKPQQPPQAEGPPALGADWQKLRQSDTGQQIRQKIVAADGLAKTYRWPQKNLDNCRLADSGLAFAGEGQLQTVPQALGWPPCWHNFGQLVIRYRLQSPKPKPGLRLCLRSEQGELRLPLEKSKHWRSDTLALEELALINNQAFRYPGSDTAHYRVLGLRLEAKGPARLAVKKLALLPGERAKGPVVDRFGQRKAQEWPGKIDSARELRAQLKAEKQLLESMQGERPRGPKVAAGNGYFQVKKAGGHWFLLDPEGRLFWSLGVTGVRPLKPDMDATQWRGRRWLFDSLPPRSGPTAQAYTGAEKEQVRFHAWNLLRKYGDFETWRQHCLRRLKRWGYNTLGSWSSEAFLKGDQFPATGYLDSRQLPISELCGVVPDVFHPDYESLVDSAIRAQAAPYRHHRNLLGWFVDNEIHWQKISPSDSGQKLCQRRYHSWAQKRKGQGKDTSLKAFRVAIAKRYFRAIRQALEQADPNHLYLGCRYLGRLPDKAFLRVSGRYVDVQSINIYDYSPDTAALRKLYRYGGRKPILIGEHHVPLKTKRAVAPLYSTFSHQEREHYYRQYIRKAAQTPYVVGAHWYQWADQPVLGRTSNGENQCWGVVDITDRPYPDMLRALGAIRDSLPRWSGMERINGNGPMP